MNEFYDKPDKTLVEFTLLGNEVAFEELLRRHENSVKGTAYKITENEYSAQDACQDAFVSAWMHLSALRDGEKFGSWVCAIAKNHAVHLQQHYRSAIPAISLSDVEHLDLSTTQDLDEQMDLHNAIEALSEKIQKAIRLHYFHGYSVAEIAKITGVAEGTVRWRLSQGRNQLRKGYGIMEKDYNENQPMLARVMQQVNALKLWRLKENKAGFEEAFHNVMALIEQLEDSKEKSYALADTLQMGYWWLPGHENDQVLARMKQAALDGHNDEVMSTIAGKERCAHSGEDSIRYILQEQIPFLEQHNFSNALGETLFWLGFEYHELKRREEALDAFQRAEKQLPGTHVYHACTKAAAYIEKLLGQKENIGMSACGDELRIIDGKLYFWSEPGYGDQPNDQASSLFWNASGCDGLIYDPALSKGDTVTSSDGLMVLTCLDDNAAVDGFEHCTLYEWKGLYCGITHCKTWYCPGVGMVQQEVRRHNLHRIWKLTKYTVQGEGMMPFAPGNRWEYTALGAKPDSGENFYEMTGCTKTHGVLVSVNWNENHRFEKPFEKKFRQCREEYYTEDENGQAHLKDIRHLFPELEALATTPREKRQAAIANTVMNRIMDTSLEINPETKEVGRWNFFQIDEVVTNDKKVLLNGFYNEIHFEWKNTQNMGVAGRAVLYSFFDDIIHRAMGCIWSDQWIDGYTLKERVRWQRVTRDVAVTEGHRVETPTGVFENCRKLCFELEDCIGYFNGHSEVWYAKGVGIVQYCHPYGENNLAVWQLTSYQGTDDSYFPAYDGVYRKYEPQNVTDGWHGSLELTFDTNEENTVIFRNASGTQDRANYEACIK